MGKLKYLLIVGVLIFLGGVAVFAYPFIMSVHHDREQTSVRYDVDAAVARLDTETIERMWREARAYNDSLLGLGMAISDDQYIYAPTEDNYLKCLDFSNGTMGYLEIPKIEVSLPIYHGTTDEILSKGVGHIYGTSLPIGGAGTHAALTSHSGLADTVLFSHLDELEQNDIFYIHVIDAVLAYRVDEIRVVEPYEVSSLVPKEGEDHVTLITCYPVTINTHRLLVRGTRVPELEVIKEGSVQAEVQTHTGAIRRDNVFGDSMEESRKYLEERALIRRVYIGAGAAVGVFILLLILFVITGRRKR